MLLRGRMPRRGGRSLLLGRTLQWTGEKRKEMQAEQAAVNKDIQEHVWRPQPDYGLGLGRSGEPTKEGVARESVEGVLEPGKPDTSP
jgi:hypothetical protein